MRPVVHQRPSSVTTGVLSYAKTCDTGHHFHNPSWDRVMRDYAKVAPQFWTGPTGKQIRQLGHDVQVLALYLMTCPSANMLGLYYLPLPTLCHETGSPSKGALKALRSLSEARFCQYDERSEYVWVYEMARFQIAESLHQNDRRVQGIKNDLKTLRNTPFFNGFLEKYREAFHLHDISPFEAPSKPLRSQEQEQEQEQEQDIYIPPSKPSRPKNKKRQTAQESPRRLPTDFTVSDAVKAWADKNGYTKLEEHLAHFRDAATAKGYTYVDWDAAFRNAIRDDWAKLGSVPTKDSRPPSKTDPQPNWGKTVTAKEVWFCGCYRNDPTPCKSPDHGKTYEEVMAQ